MSNNKGLNVIKASAGSGKTFTLALKYIEQVLFVQGKNGMLELRQAKDYHQHILAITFTNKATQEMKTRIVKELYTLSQDPTKSDFYGLMTKRCSAQAIKGLQDAAKQALSDLLFNYTAFRVSTIDSFFQSVLRNFARELDRDYNYDLELNDKYVTKIVTQNFLSSLGKERKQAGDKMTQVERWVQEFQSLQLDNNDKWNSLYDLSDNQYGPMTLAKFAADNINKEFVRKKLDELCDYLSGNNNVNNLERITKFRDLLKLAAKKHREKLESTDWQDCAKRILNDMDASEIDPRKTFYKFYTQGIYTVTDSLKKIIDNPSDPFRKNHGPTDKDTLDKLSKLISDLCKHNKMMQFFNLMVKNLSYVGLLGEINKKLEEYRRESNTLLIADTNELINKVVTTYQDAPFIYERTGTWINSYMLDEFQDTSVTQYSNFLPLIKESLSREQDNFNLVIGDVKQAIYRFRNADPSLFRDKIEDDFSGQITHDMLRVNWRSLKNIIDFNNTFTGAMISLPVYKQYDALKRSYMPNGKTEDYEQLLSPKHSNGQQGMVKVMFKDNNGIALEKLDNVTSIIVDYLLELHERFEWKDIIILVNKNKEGRAVIEQVLQHNNEVRSCGEGITIPIVSGEMMNLNRSTSVRRIINMLRFIDVTNYVLNSDDDTSDQQSNNEEISRRATRQQLAEQKQFAVLDEFVKQLDGRDNLTSEQVGEVLNQCFEIVNAQAHSTAEQQMQQYATILSSILSPQQSELMSLVSVVEQLIASHINSTESTDETIFLHAFQNCVIKFSSQNNGGTVREFLRYWDRNKNAINVPDSGDVNAVNVLTIHKSKGLEADCVVIPCANWSTQASDNDLWVSKNDWLDNGGKQMLNDMVGSDWGEDIVPPIMVVPRGAMDIANEYGYLNKINDKESENDIIDNLNRTYVAFTRPRKELHIFAVGKPEKEGTITQQLYTIVPHIENMNQVIDGQFQLGQPWAQEEKTSPQANEWINKEIPPYAVASSQVMVNLPSDVGSMRETGKRLHAMLSLINSRSDIDKAVRLCVRRGIITNDPTDPWNATVARERLTALLNREDVKEWFDDGNKVYNERPLMVETREHDFTNKRPDRVIQRPDGSWVVIDYKFGQRDDEKHFKQVRPYMFALNKATGKYVTGYIWYLTLDTIVPV